MTAGRPRAWDKLPRNIIEDGNQRRQGFGSPLKRAGRRYVGDPYKDTRRVQPFNPMIKDHKYRRIALLAALYAALGRRFTRTLAILVETRPAGSDSGGGFFMAADPCDVLSALALIT